MPHFYSNQTPLWQYKTKAQHKFDFLLSSDLRQRKLELDKAYSGFVIQAVRGLEPTNFYYDEKNHRWLVTTNINFGGERLKLVIEGEVRPGVFGKFNDLPNLSEGQILRYEKQPENIDEIYFFPNTETLPEAAFRLEHRKDFFGELVSNTRFAAFIACLPKIKKQINDYFQHVQPELAINLREELINQLSDLASDAMDMPLLQNLVGSPLLNLKPEKDQSIYFENGVAHWRRKLYIVGVKYEAQNKHIQDTDYPIASVIIDSAFPNILTKESMVDCTIELECYSAKFYNTPLIKNLNLQPSPLSKVIEKISQYQNEFIELLTQEKQSVQITEKSMQSTLSKARLQQFQGIGAPRIKTQRDEDDENIENLYTEETSTFIACGQGAREYQEDRSGSHLIIVDSKSENLNMGQSLYNAVLNLGATCSSFEQGATLVASIVYQNKIYTAGVGDSSAFLVYQAKHGWETCRLNVLHKPTVLEENHHVQSVGGFVEVDRLNGRLALSRALGDKHVFPGVRYEPDVSYIELNSTTEAYLLLCSDGMTDVLNEQDITNIFANLTNLLTDDTKNIASLIRSKAYQLGSNDNTTVLVTPLIRSRKAKELNENQAILAFVADGHGLFRANDEVLENQTANYIKTHLVEELKKEIAEPTLNFKDLELNKKILNELKLDTQRLIYLIHSPAKLKPYIRKIQEKIATYFLGGLASPEAQPYLKYLAKLLKTVEQHSELVKYVITENLKPGNKLSPLQKMANLVKIVLQDYKIVDYIGVKLTVQQRKILLDFTMAELASATCSPFENLCYPSAVSIVTSILEIDPLSEWEKFFHLYSKVNQLISSNLNEIHNDVIKNIKELHDIIFSLEEEALRNQLLELLNNYEKNILSNLLDSEQNRFLFSKIVSFAPDSISFFWKNTTLGFSQDILSKIDEIHKTSILNADNEFAQLIDLNLNEQLKAGNAKPKNLISAYLQFCVYWQKEENNLPISYQTAKFLLQLNSFESHAINNYLIAYKKYRDTFFREATEAEKLSSYDEFNASSKNLINKYKNFFKALTLMFCLDERVIDLFAQAGFELTAINVRSLKLNPETDFEFKHIKIKNNVNTNLESIKKLNVLVQNFIQLISILPTEFYPRNYIKLLEEKNINVERYKNFLQLVIFHYQDADVRRLEQEILRLKKKLILADLPEPNNWYKEFKLKFNYHEKWLALSDQYFLSYKNSYQILNYKEPEENFDLANQNLNNLKKMIDQNKSKITELIEVPPELLELKIVENKPIIKSEENDIFGDYQDILKESLGLIELNIAVKNYLGDLSFVFSDYENPLYLLKKYYWSVSVGQDNQGRELTFIFSLLKNAVNNNNKLLQKTCYLAIVSILIKLDLTMMDNFKKAYLCCLEIEMFIFNQVLNDEDHLKLNLNKLKNALQTNFEKFNIISQDINYRYIRKFYKQTYMQREFYFSLFPAIKEIKSGLEHENQLKECLKLFNESFDSWINFFAQLSFPEFKPHFLVSQMAINFLQMGCELIFKLYAKQDNSETCENTINKIKLLIFYIYPWLVEEKQIRIFWRRLIDVISNNTYLNGKMSQFLLNFVISVVLNAEKFFETFEGNQKPNFTSIKQKLFDNNDIFELLSNELDSIKHKLSAKPNNQIMLLKAKVICVHYITLELYAKEFLQVTTDFSKFSSLLIYFFSLLDQNKWMIDVELLELLTKANNCLYVPQIRTNNFLSVNNASDMNYLPKILEFFDYRLSQFLDSDHSRKAYEKSCLEMSNNIMQSISLSASKAENILVEVTDLISSPDKKWMTILKMYSLLDNLHESELKNKLKNKIVNAINIEELQGATLIDKTDKLDLELCKLRGFFENDHIKNKMPEKVVEISAMFQKLKNFLCGRTFEQDNIKHLAIFYKINAFSNTISDLYEDNEIQNDFVNFSAEKNNLDKNLLKKIEQGKVNLIQAFEIIPAEDKQLLYQAVNAALKSYEGRKQVKVLVKDLSVGALQSLQLPVVYQQVLRKFNSLLVSSSLSNLETIIPNNKKSNHTLIKKIVDKVNLSDKTKLNLAKYSPDLFDKIDYKKLCHEADAVIEALLMKPALLNTLISKRKIQPKLLFKKFRQEHWERIIFNASHPLAKTIVTHPLVKAEFDKAKISNKNVSNLVEFICKLTPDADGKLPAWSLQTEDMSVLSFSTIVRWGLEERDETIKRFIVSEPNLLQKLLTLVVQPKATLLMNEQTVQLNAVCLLKTILGSQLKKSNDEGRSLATIFAENVLANELLKNLCKQEPVKSILLAMHIAENLKVKYLDKDVTLTVNKNELTKLKSMLEPMLDKKAAKGKEKEDEENYSDLKPHSRKSSMPDRVDNVSIKTQAASKQQQLERLNERRKELTLFFKQAKAGEIQKPLHLLEMDLEMAKDDLKSISHEIALLA